MVVRIRPGTLLMMSQMAGVSADQSIGLFLSLSHPWFAIVGRVSDSILSAVHAQWFPFHLSDLMALQSRHSHQVFSPLRFRPASAHVNVLVHAWLPSTLPCCLERRERCGVSKFFQA